MASLIGTAPDQLPTNGDLGSMAFKNFVMQEIVAGLGITAGVGTVCRGQTESEGPLRVSRMLIDLTGLSSGGTAGDIIGINGTTDPCHFGQITSAQGVILAGRMICLETPAGGDTDFDVYSATEGTGVEDSPISGLTETLLLNAGAQTAGTITNFSALPASNSYLYLVGQGTANTVYSAGIFLIELFGYA